MENGRFTCYIAHVNELGFAGLDFVIYRERIGKPRMDHGGGSLRILKDYVSNETNGQIFVLPFLVFQLNHQQASHTTRLLLGLTDPLRFP